MKSYTPRKKKIQSTRVIGAMKHVRIDSKTEIMVSVNVPDDEARERYLSRLQSAQRILGGYKVASHKEELKDEDTPPQEELAAIIDDSVLPEQE